MQRHGNQQRMMALRLQEQPGNAEELSPCPADPLAVFSCFLSGAEVTR